MRYKAQDELLLAEAWPPLAAPKDAKPTGAWYVIKRENGDLQWAYKDHPVYTYAKDAAGAAPTGENEIWKVARP